MYGFNFSYKDKKSFLLLERKKAFKSFKQGLYYRYFFSKKSLIWELCTISSLNVYAPVFSDFISLMHLVKSFPVPVFSVATTFFAMLFYFISLCRVTFFKIGLYFFRSSLSGVFLRFFVVMYLDVPGSPLSLCSVHSIITCTLFPFLAMRYRFNSL